MKIRWTVLCGLVLGVLAWTVFASMPAWAQPAAEAGASLVTAPLPLQQVVRNLEMRNAQRAAALSHFEGERVYRLQYRGFPTNHDAEMVVKVSYRAPDSKEFEVVSESGSKFVQEHVFKKLLEGEKEAATAENRSQASLTSANYDFELAGYEVSPDGPRYVLNLLPKTKNKFLYRGKIWIDAKDFAVVRIVAEPGKNPSMWIKNTQINHTYVKVDDFWLPEENRTQSVLRLGGTATLSIEYRGYKIIQAAPVSATVSAADDSAPALRPVASARTKY